MSRRRLSGGALLALALGCGPVVDGSADGSEGGSGTSTSTSTSTTSVSTSSTATTVVPSDETSQPESSDTLDESSFVQDPDASVFPSSCSLWEQDCPRGTKCMPYSSDGSGSFDATLCAEVVRDPRGVGESCTVFESLGSGMDDCELGAICWNADPDTLIGECVAFCEGPEAEPTCGDECSSCSISGSSILALCLPSCDPVAQDCAQGDGCYPIGTGFTCAPTGIEQGAVGSPCEFINICAPGSFCAGTELLPECEGPSCCAPFCDLEADDSCDALLPGTVCRPWYDELPTPSCVDLERVGGCLAPP